MSITNKLGITNSLKKPNQKINQKPNQKKRFESQNIKFIDDISLLKNNLEFPLFEFDGKYGYSNVLFHLKKNEGIRAEGGSMNYMGNGINLDTSFGNSIFGAIGRKFSGTSFFFNVFFNESENISDLALSSGSLGDIGCFYIPPGKTFYAVSDSYVCSTLNLKIESGLKLGGIITGYGMVFVSVTAIDSAGLVWISSFGRIRPLTIKPNEKVGIDNGILLGFESNITMHTKTVGGIKSTLFSGEGLITEIYNDSNNDITIYTHGKNRIAFNESVCQTCPQKGGFTIPLSGGNNKKKLGMKKIKNELSNRQKGNKKIINKMKDKVKSHKNN